MATAPYEVPPLTPPEQQLVNTINQTWTKDQAMSELTTHLQIAIEVELATIPIYLGTYYTINRTVELDDQNKTFPNSDISRFADTAGAAIMSVAVEEMLHMSLSSNVLYALNVDPQVYLKAPDSYPAHLPGHAENVLCGPDNDSRNIPIPLAKFSFDQLSHFLAIEYPAPVNAPPEPGNWDTIGQIYSYIRCIISSDLIEDSDFQLRQTNDQQIRATEYSPNNIDTVFPKAKFDFANPKPVPAPGSTAKIAGYASDEDSHVGAVQLLHINSCETALEAIATICFQGEGFDQTAYDDPSKAELSHYYKFLTTQSMLDGYTQAYIEAGKQGQNNVAPEPPAPPVPYSQFTQADLDVVVFNAPTNPVASQFTDGQEDLVNIADGLFQYMLVMTETTYKIPSDKQKIYFNRTMHQSMIWVLDKLLQQLRQIQSCADPSQTLCATFANYNLGTQAEAFATLTNMVTTFQGKYGKDGTEPASWYTNSGVDYYLNKILELPDVSPFWQTATPVEPDYLKVPDQEQDQGTNPNTPTPASQQVTSGGYAGTPQWPLQPPKTEDLPQGAERHACMGLNSCKNQGRTLENDCAGQGFCSTALAYDPQNPSEGSVSDHTCHVLNDCRNQGGCGLYGTQSEFMLPGHNDCQSQGSCATPINAERFFTDGVLRGQSVWMQARQVFTNKVWPQLREQNPELPDKPPAIPGSDSKPDLFQYGPTIGWIENDNDGQGMTACGSSGMSGAGSCA